DHLPELRLRVDRLEEDEIHDIGNVDAGIEHVNGDRDVRALLRSAEVVYQGLGVVHSVVNRSRKRTFELRIVSVEALDDELRVSLILGKDDRLADSVASLDLQAVLHQMRQNLIDRVFVEEPSIQRGRLDSRRDSAVVVPLERVPHHLLDVRQFVVVDSLTLETEGNVDT